LKQVLGVKILSGFIELKAQFPNICNEDILEKLNKIIVFELDDLPGHLIQKIVIFELVSDYLKEEIRFCLHRIRDY